MACCCEYIMDGCFARAHQMARLAEKRGIVLGKVFFHGVLRPTKKIPFKDAMSGMKNPDGGDSFWGWHVAPVVYVTGKNGETEPMVLDPAITNAPTPLETYREMLLGEGKPPTRIVDEYFGSRYQFVNRLASPLAASSYSPTVDEVSKSILNNYEKIVRTSEYDNIIRKGLESETNK